MKREKKLIELGAASIETKGPDGRVADIVGKQYAAGLGRD